MGQLMLGFMKLQSFHPWILLNRLLWTLLYPSRSWRERVYWSSVEERAQIGNKKRVLDIGQCGQRRHFRIFSALVIDLEIVTNVPTASKISIMFDPTS
jgi:hypothetical protein